MKKLMVQIILVAALLAGCAVPGRTQETVSPYMYEWKTSNISLQQLPNENYYTYKQDGLELTLQAACWSPEDADTIAQRVYAFRDAVAQRVTLGGGRVYFGGRLKNDQVSNQLYIRMNGKRELSFQEYWKIYLLMTGDEQDYGAAYGMTARICRELELCPVEMPRTESELQEFFGDPKNLYVLDLALPLLGTEYCGGRIASYARSAAIALGAFQEIRDVSFQREEAVTQEKNAWLESIGLEPAYVPSIRLPFRLFAGNQRDEYPYMISDEYCIFLFSPEDVKEQGYRAFMKEYLEIRDLISADFHDAQVLLEGYTASKVQPVKIFTKFCKAEDGIAGSFYTHEGISLYHDWDTAEYSLLHEYIHYLINDHIHYNHAHNEALTEALSIYYCENRLLQRSMRGKEAFVEVAKHLQIWDSTTRTADMGAYNDIKAQYYYHSEAGDFGYICISGVYILRPKNPNILQLTYSEGGSFMHYLLERFGWKAVMDVVGSTEEMTKLWGKSFDEMYQEWAQANERGNGQKYTWITLE